MHVLLDRHAVRHVENTQVSAAPQSASLAHSTQKLASGSQTAPAGHSAELAHDVKWAQLPPLHNSSGPQSAPLRQSTQTNRCGSQMRPLVRQSSSLVQGTGTSVVKLAAPPAPEAP